MKRGIHLLIFGVLIFGGEVSGQSYLDKLRGYLTKPNTITQKSKVAVPANSKIDTLSLRMPLYRFQSSKCIITYGNDSITIVGSNGRFHELKPEYEGLKYQFIGYDSSNNVVYSKLISTDQNYEGGDFVVYGISLETGKSFEVAWDTANISSWFSHEYRFSPDMSYLLKAGDKNYDASYSDDPEGYGWSLTNTKTGKETFFKLKRYHEFVYDLMWVDNSSFTYMYVKIPFHAGFVYDMDYKYYHSLMNREPIPGIVLTDEYLNTILYQKDLNFNIIHKIQYSFDYGRFKK